MVHLIVLYKVRDVKTSYQRKTFFIQKGLLDNQYICFLNNRVGSNAKTDRN